MPAALAKLQGAARNTYVRVGSQVHPKTGWPVMGLQQLASQSMFHSLLLQLAAAGTHPLSLCAHTSRARALCCSWLPARC